MIVTSSKKDSGPWQFIRPYWKALTLASFLLLCTAALALQIPRLLGQTIEALGSTAPQEQVPRLAITMIAIAIAQACTRIASRIILFNTARQGEYDLRSRLFRHLLYLDSAYFREHPPGEIMSRLTSDVQTVRSMWGPGLLNMVNTSFLFTVALILMIRIDPWLSLYALIPYPLMFVLGLFFGKQIYKTSSKVQKHLGQLSSTIQQDLSSISMIKSYNLEDQREESFERFSTQLVNHNMALTRVRGKLVPTLGAVAALGTVIVLFLGGSKVIQDDNFSLGQLIEFNAYLAALVWPTLAMGWMISLLQRGKASWQRLEGILLATSQVQDGSIKQEDLKEIQGEVEFRNLTIKLDGEEIIKDISVSIPPGSTTAIVGRTGCGKSTLVSALPRLLLIPEKSVFLDSNDICELPLSYLRGCIGFAPQEAFLFSTTIGNNIRFGVEQRVPPPKNEQETLDAIQDAAIAAGLENDLKALPKGLDTIVGERGITLSGGQRQRVALARALATLPSILILDDSLSSVDAETERTILGHLAQNLAGRTTIIISHRLAAVRNADLIMVLEDGQLVEKGRHQDLLALNGVYTKIYETQLREQQN